jgi:uncharacterized protein (UPF0335 family)
MSEGQVRISELENETKQVIPEVKEINPPDKSAGFGIEILSLSK